MKGTKTQKGITLIALIITIIVLLILAVVTIGAVQNGGIITKAQDTKLIYQIAQIEEALKLKMQEEKIAVVKGELPATPDNLDDFTGDSMTYDIWFLYIKYIASYYTNLSCNIYKDTAPNYGEIIRENLLWLTTDMITGGENFELYMGSGPEGFGLTSLGISTTLGQNGTVSKAIETNYDISSRDVFYFDGEYNVYYIDSNGNVITSKGIYSSDEIFIGDEYFNVEALPEEDKVVYQGIYEGAYAFTGDSNYASYLAKNDLDYTTETNTFMFNGYLYVSIVDETETIVKYNGTELKYMSVIMTRPDWSVVEILNDTNPITYYMDENYVMYKYDSDDDILYNEKDEVIATEVTTKTSGKTGEKIITEDGVEYTYTYTYRFDNKGVMLTAIPEKETLDINSDLSDLNVDVWTSGIKSDAVKNIILPSTVKTLDALALTRRMSSSSHATTDFADMPNLEYIDLSRTQITKLYAKTFTDCSNLKTVVMPDTIKTISEDAFKGCSKVEVRFKDGEAPVGSPWGGTDITITSK